MTWHDEIPAIIVRAWRIGRRRGRHAASLYMSRRIGAAMAQDFVAGLKAKVALDDRFKTR